MPAEGICREDVGKVRGTAARTARRLPDAACRRNVRVASGDRARDERGHLVPANRPLGTEDTRPAAETDLLGQELPDVFRKRVARVDVRERRRLARIGEVVGMTALLDERRERRPVHRRVRAEISAPAPESDSPHREAHDRVVRERARRSVAEVVHEEGALAVELRVRVRDRDRRDAGDSGRNGGGDRLRIHDSHGIGERTAHANRRAGSEVLSVNRHGVSACRRPKRRLDRSHHGSRG